MKFKKMNIRDVIHMHVRELLEAEEKPKEKSDFMKSIEDKAATFFCPRHHLPLKPKLVKRTKIEPGTKEAEDAKREKIAKNFKGVIPPTSQSTELTSKGKINNNGWMVRWYMCPLADDTVDPKDIKNAYWLDDAGNIVEPGEEPAPGRKRARPEAYNKWARELKTDPSTGKERWVSVEQTARCDYRVTPQKQFPGQKVPNVAVGEVAMEMGYADWQGSGPPHGESPAPRSQSGVRAIVSAGGDKETIIKNLKEKGYGPLVDAIKKMENDGFHMEKIVHYEKADAPSSLAPGFTKGLEKDALAGQTLHSVDRSKPAQSSAGKSPHLGGTVDSEKAGSSDAEPLQLPKASAEPIFNTKSSLSGATSVGQKSYIDKSAGRKLEGWSKAKLQYSPDGKPLFTGDDVHYLAYYLPMGLQKRLNKAAEESGSTEKKSVYGSSPWPKGDDIQALFFKLGWDMPDKAERHVVMSPQEKSTLAKKAPVVHGGHQAVVRRAGSSDIEQLESEPLSASGLDDDDDDADGSTDDIEMSKMAQMRKFIQSLSPEDYEPAQKKKLSPEEELLKHLGSKGKK
jgi:hypothetical protein